MEDKREMRPLILEVEDAKMEIIQSINNAMHVHKLPCYIIEMILSDVYAQIKDGAKNELAVAKAQMEETV